MTRPIRIALLTPGWPGHDTPNGIAAAVFHMAMGLKAEGHTPVIIALSTDGPTPEGIPVIPVIPRPWSLVQKVRSKLGTEDIAQEVCAESIADALERAANDAPIDAIIMEETQGWATASIRRGIAPVVIFLHGPWLLHKSVQSDGNTVTEAYRERREAAAFRAAAALISPSQNVLDAVEASVDVAHVPRCVIPNAFPAGPPSAEPRPDSSILFVGRFDRHKGGDTIIEAFRLLHDRRPETRLTFAGPDRGFRHENGRVIQMAEILDTLPDTTRDAITAPGSQSTEQVAALRRTHKIAVIASRYENLNYTMLEAMAAGQAIVSTRVGGPAEVFEEGKTALLVPPENPVAMADALERLIDDPALATRLGHAARVTLETGYAPEAIAQRTVAFLGESL